MSPSPEKIWRSEEGLWSNRDLEARKRVLKGQIQGVIEAVEEVGWSVSPPVVYGFAVDTIPDGKPYIHPVVEVVRVGDCQVLFLAFGGEDFSYHAFARPKPDRSIDIPWLVEEEGLRKTKTLKYRQPYRFGWSREHLYFVNEDEHSLERCLLKGNFEEILEQAEKQVAHLYDNRQDRLEENTLFLEHFLEGLRNVGNLQ